jgi:Ca-activated chloride channel family protein
MRCKYCGTLQDEPAGAKICVQCGGELGAELIPYEDEPTRVSGSYVRAQLELDQIAAPAGQIVERHLVVTVETPAAVPPGEQARTQAGREPLSFVAVLDVSGSMQGDKIRAAKEAVRQAVNRLQDGDLFALVTFATDVQCPLSSWRIDTNLRQAVEGLLQAIRAGGQTALCGGLEEGIRQASTHRGDEIHRGANLVLLLSDGQANVGETDVEAVGQRAIDARTRGITVSTLGVGSDYNEALMAEVAIDGGGRFYHIADAERIAAYLAGELGEMASLAARNAAVDLHLPAGAGVQPLSAAYPVRGQTEGHTVTLGDIPTATTLEVVVRVLLPPQPAGSRLPIDGILRYQSPAGNALATPLNKVTVRYDQADLFAYAAGAVRPVVRRVLGQMQAAGVLSTAKAAARSEDDAHRQSAVALSAMRQYASLLGEDEKAREALSESEAILHEIADLQNAASPAQSQRTKAATHAAMRIQRGSKDFDT